MCIRDRFEDECPATLRARTEAVEVPERTLPEFVFSLIFSAFLHGNLLHIGGNMLFLWIFGNNVEEAFGTFGYVAMYLLTGLIATAGFVIFNQDSTIPLVGASGAIAGVLGAYLVLYPTHKVMSWLLLFFVPVPAVIFLGIWFLSQLSLIHISEPTRPY